MQKFNVTVLNSDGEPVAGTVQVKDKYSGLNVTLYEDNETTTKTNPVTADSAGNAPFKVNNGVYDIVVNNGATSKTIYAVKISDGAEMKLLTNGEAITINYGEVVSIDASGNAVLAHNDGTEAVAKARYVCITRGGLAAGSTGVFSGPGTVAELSGGTAGASVFLDVDGLLTTTALDPTDPANIGKFRTYLGEWLSTTELNFQPTEPVEI